MIKQVRSRARCGFLALVCCAGPVAAQEPLAALDWLSDTVSVPPPAPPIAEQPAVTDSARPGQIVVRPLDRPIPDLIGLTDPADRGLPGDLWAESEASTLIRQVQEMRPPSLPSMQKLLHDVLTVWATPPRDSAMGQAFYLARLDALLAMGRFQSAREMMTLAGYQDPEIFRRWFDLTILTGSETQACQRMRALPEITPTYPARIFCLARSGDWHAAAVTLETARALGVVTLAETERLTRFLDAHSQPGLLPPPATPSPLDFLLYEAIGEPLRTPSLPLPFAHADLRPITGWMARIEAAERLARYGAVAPGDLWSIYDERKPAASGLPWDRVAAAREVARALRADDADALTDALPRAWDLMSEAHLLPALAKMVGAKVAELKMEGRPGRIATRLALLAGHSADSPDPSLAALVERRDLPEDQRDPRLAAIAAGLAEDIPQSVSALIEQNRTGEALLHAVRLVEAGAGNNLDALTDGLSILSATGLRDTAFRAAIELVVMDAAQ